MYNKPNIKKEIIQLQQLSNDVDLSINNLESELINKNIYEQDQDQDQDQDWTQYLKDANDFLNTYNKYPIINVNDILSDENLYIMKINITDCDILQFIDDFFDFSVDNKTAINMYIQNKKNISNTLIIKYMPKILLLCDNYIINYELNINNNPIELSDYLTNDLFDELNISNELFEKM
jgi:hypothetical protein